MLSLPLLYPWMQVSRVMIPYFCGALRSLKAAFMLPGSKAYARMTAGGCVAGWDKLSRTVVPPLSSPLGLTRGSRAKSPYFGGVSRGGKAVLVFLDARMRKHDDWGWVSVRDSSPPSPSKLGPRVRDKETLFIMEPARDDLNFIFNHTINKPVF